MKKGFLLRIACFVAAVLLFAVPSAAANDAVPFDVNAKSAVLMEATTGTVLYSKNQDEALPPASVTKVMTLLLVMEAIDSGALSLDEDVTVSEYAASMGGSQVYLEPGETMKTEDLLKCVVIASANDAAVTLAERVAGSETAFVSRMNERAEQLGMKNTHFENVTGLDDDTVDHVTSAYDIALMSRELMKHEKIFDYTTVWMDSIRDGAFGLTNTNRLIRFYSGATGLKTGSTAKAKFCISATAERDGMHLIAVIMGSDTRDTRNEAAKQLFDWGFATYSLYRDDGGLIARVPVKGGKADDVGVVCPPIVVLLPRSGAGRIAPEYVIAEYVSAPLKAGDAVGTVNYTSDGKTVASSTLTASENVQRIGYFGLLYEIVKAFFLK